MKSVYLHVKYPTAAGKKQSLVPKMCRLDIPSTYAGPVQLRLKQKTKTRMTASVLNQDPTQNIHASAISTPLRWIFKKRAIKSYSLM